MDVSLNETRRKIALKWICTTIVVLLWTIAVDCIGYRAFLYFDEVVDSSPGLYFYEVVFLFYLPGILGTTIVGILSAVLATKSRSNVRVRVVVFAILILGTPVALIGHYFCEIEQERLKDSIYAWGTVVTEEDEKVEMVPSPGNTYEEMIFCWNVFISTAAFFTTGLIGIAIDRRMLLQQTNPRMSDVF